MWLVCLVSLLAACSLGFGCDSLVPAMDPAVLAAAHRQATLAGTSGIRSLRSGPPAFTAWLPNAFASNALLLPVTLLVASRANVALRFFAEQRHPRRAADDPDFIRFTGYKGRATKLRVKLNFPVRQLHPLKRHATKGGARWAHWACPKQNQ